LVVWLVPLTANVAETKQKKVAIDLDTHPRPMTAPMQTSKQTNLVLADIAKANEQFRYV
jgi:hypothetical protein